MRVVDLPSKMLAAARTTFMLFVKGIVVMTTTAIAMTMTMTWTE